MKRISTYLMGLSILALTTVSCSKEAHDETTRQQAVVPQVIKADVSVGQTYVLNMGAGTTASIVTQAQHYQLSEVATAPNGGSIYKYIAQKGFAGTDEVTLQQTVAATQGDGCHRNHSNGLASTSLRTVVIKLNVGN